MTVLASASQARISHLSIKTTADSLRVNLKVDSDFAPEMKAAVLNGLPIRFTISISLYEVNDLWFDKKVAAKMAFVTVWHASANLLRIKYIFTSFFLSQRYEFFPLLHHRRRTTATFAVGCHGDRLQ